MSLQNGKLHGWLRASTVKTVTAAIFLAGCGDSGDDGGGGSAPPIDTGAKAATFNETTAPAIAALAAVDIDLLDTIGRLTLGMVGGIQEAGAAASSTARAMYPIGNMPGMCMSGGSAALVWDDADDSTTFSVGDKATLTFTDCNNAQSGANPEPINGTLAMTLKGMNMAAGMSIDADVSMDVVIDETDSTGAQRKAFAAQGTAAIATADAVNYTMIYKFEGDQSIGEFRGTQQTAKGDLAMFYRFGCGTMQHAFSVSNPAAFTVSVNGVVTGASEGTLTQSTTTPVMFMRTGPSTAAPESGVMAFESGSQPCSGAGVLLGVQGDGSSMTMTALGGGVVRLEGTTAEGAPFTVTKNWDELD